MGGAAASTRESFESSFERPYLDGWKAASGEARFDPRFRRSAAVRQQAVQAFLREYRPLEEATRAELRTLVESGQALQDFDQAMSTLGLDGSDLMDVIAMHHAVHWAVVNGDRIREEQLPAIREAVASSTLLEELAGTGDAGKQQVAERAAILTALRSREYARLLGSGDRVALRRYGDRVAADVLSRHGIDLREERVDQMRPAGTRPAR
ncbi:hypothetical protein [Luteimonas saliphila]|uniref:hypothetical protein n=1 Tax=Luteimonas saliphila TaxID=2804919 RepID=UPI00192DEC3B|nr:hypothetical protein [Luteimonas saliphila]